MTPYLGPPPSPLTHTLSGHPFTYSTGDGTVQYHYQAPPSTMDWCEESAIHATECDASKRMRNDVRTCKLSDVCSSLLSPTSETTPVAPAQHGGNKWLFTPDMNTCGDVNRACESTDLFDEILSDTMLEHLLDDNIDNQTDIKPIVSEV